VKTIIDQHKNEKGIVHCTTFQIAKFIKENVRSDRFLIHTSEDREAVLERHKKGKKPTILLSPSMTEGIDLVGDQSRFQILMKVPFPYLGDEVTRKRMEKNRKWYNLVTARTIIQSLGRSVRNERDHAVSYIIDGDWERFYSQNKAIFPLDFKAAYDQKDPK
jgi:Rad3-related DNA helicase